MKIYRAENYDAMSRRAANILSAQVILKPDSVLGLATGSTPVGMYRQLVNWYEKGDIDFSQVHTVNLDEYLGLAPDHDQSYRYFMQQNLFDHINVRPENTNVPDGLAADPEAECARYDQVIDSLGGTDVQVLGIPSRRYGEDVAAFLIPRNGCSIRPEDVRDFCRGRVAWHKIPRYVAVVEDFPKTANGKVQKFRLREMAAELFPNVK